MSLFNRVMRTDENGSHLIWNIPYSQYFRTELQMGKTFVFGRNDGLGLAFRMIAGIGVAYGNSSVLPFEKLFYGGGANSLRGWQSRTVGPGNAPLNENFIIPNQTGDVKLEANMEFRFKLLGKLRGALFADAGNVWSIHEDADPSERFTFAGLPGSIAADWGAGLRLDLNFILIRVDLGMKVHDPSREEGDRWIGPNKWLTKGGYAFHFGVGYPF
jgi:outer membrane protein assembly factor BamA